MGNFRVLNFRGLLRPRKFFNNENFPIYGITTILSVETKEQNMGEGPGLSVETKQQNMGEGLGMRLVYSWLY